MSSGREIRLIENPDGWWTARDLEVEVSTQGQTREEALSNLDEAVALRRDEIGHEPSEEELREAGIDPSDNTTGDEEPPDVLR